MNDKPTRTIDSYGIEQWELNGKIHRDDGPAIIFNSSERRWYQNGQLHREDGPAIEDNGIKSWWFRDRWSKVRSQEEFEALLPILKIGEVIDE